MSKHFQTVLLTTIACLCLDIGIANAEEQGRIVLETPPAYVQASGYFCTDEKNLLPFIHFRQSRQDIAGVPLVVQAKKEGLYCPLIIGALVQTPQYAYTITASEIGVVDVFALTLSTSVLYTWQDRRGVQI